MLPLYNNMFRLVSVSCTNEENSQQENFGETVKLMSNAKSQEFTLFPPVCAKEKNKKNVTHKVLHPQNCLHMYHEVGKGLLETYS